jgi:hypothetical protein
MREHAFVLWVALVFPIGVLSILFSAGARDQANPTFKSVIPKTWDDAAMATLEVPLADPIGSPKHVSADYYYRIPVRPIYKQYPVYAPGHEPLGYMDWLKQQEPVIVWDDAGHRPALRTEADWVKAGEIVFDAAITQGVITTVADVRDPSWYSRTAVLVAKGGVMPFYRYVIRQKGEVELGRLACASCHTRVMPDGTTLNSSFPGGVRQVFALFDFTLGADRPEILDAVNSVNVACRTLERCRIFQVALHHFNAPPCEFLSRSTARAACQRSQFPSLEQHVVDHRPALPPGRAGNEHRFVCVVWHVHVSHLVLGSRGTENMVAQPR